MYKNCITLTAFALTLTAASVRAEPPEVIGGKTSLAGMGWRFDVTVSHPDTGWDHYADGWEVLDSKGNRLGFRELLHPHVDEQPFTRALSGIEVPEGAAPLFVRPRCSVDGWAGESFPVAPPG